MKNQAAAPAKEPVKPTTNFPAYVEAEKLLERMAEFTKETSLRAYDYFLARGNDFGMHLDDWLKAEMEVLRPTPMAVVEDKENLIVHAAVPGFKPEEIEISINDNLLIMSGEHKMEEKKEDEKVHLNEWQSNRFCRQITLPSAVETDGVEATLKDGILNLTLKKKAAEETAKIAVIAA
jgi:HSP20 family protein